MVRVEEVDEVELAVAGRVLVARRARSREADDLAVDEGGELLVPSPRSEWFQSSAMRRGERCRCGLADQVVVGLVPARGVDAAEGLGVEITDGTDNGFGNRIGAHDQS